MSVNPSMNASGLTSRIPALLWTVLLGVFLGVGTAWWAIRKGGAAQSLVKVGPWETSLLAGSPTADPYTRARVAVVGLLALGRQETLYYVARTDSSGQALRSRCQYRIDGLAPPTRWWSLTAYADDHFLFEAPQDRFSLNGAVAQLDPRGEFHVMTGPVANPSSAALAWLPTPGDRGLELTLRLYHPLPALQQDPRGLIAPTIERVGLC
ncbi:MAG: DUF1214 domain-containing protein [Betaproteobacteria bacterium]|nr:DUF1214 domain-containing protein [Betaproteobacteria bacterium]